MQIYITKENCEIPGEGFHENEADCITRFYNDEFHDLGHFHKYPSANISACSDRTSPDIILKTIFKGNLESHTKTRRLDVKLFQVLLELFQLIYSSNTIYLISDRDVPYWAGIPISERTRIKLDEKCAHLIQNQNSEPEFPTDADDSPCPYVVKPEDLQTIKPRWGARRKSWNEIIINSPILHPQIQEDGIPAYFRSLPPLYQPEQ